MGYIKLPTNVLKGLLMLVALAAFSGCVGPARVGGATGLQLLPGDQLPMPRVADLGASERPYRVGPFDKLVVDVFGTQELSQREIQVDASGRMSFPLIGTIEVAGKTPGEIETLMSSMLRDRRFVRDPQVTVNLRQIVSQTVTIGGEVREPGLYPVIGRMTLLRAIATAKGTTEYTRKSEVFVFRSVNGRDYAAIYNIKAIQRGTYPDPEIFANDVVMVGDSQARRIFRDILQITPVLTAIIFLLR